jgi:uncharacterized protein
MSYKVSTRDISKISLNESDTVTSVMQNIAIILSTRQGTVPLYRGFGLPMNFIDKPIPVAKTLMIAEITEAIAEYEPRANLISVSFEIDESAPERLIPTVEVEIIDE